MDCFATVGMNTDKKQQIAILSAASQYNILNGDDSWLVVLTSDKVSINYAVYHVHLTAWN